MTASSEAFQINSALSRRIDALEARIAQLSRANLGDQNLTGLVNKTTTVNGHALSSNVTVSKSDVGLGSVPNTDCTTTANISDSTNKRFVTDANLTVIGNTSGTNTGNQTITLTSEATGTGTGSFAVTLSNAAVIAKVLTAYASGAGTVATTDTVLQAIQKLNGNSLLKLTRAGVVDASSPASGDIGEEFESTISSPTSWPATNGAWGNFTHLDLPAGNWRVQPMYVQIPNGATGIGQVAIALSENSGTTTTDHVSGSTQLDLGTGTAQKGATMKARIYRRSSAFTIYFKGNMVYTGGTPQYQCELTAERVP